MEFINEHFTAFICIMVLYAWNIFLAIVFIVKKFQPHDETPKVGKHKESKEVCCHLAGHLNGIDGIYYCGQCNKNYDVKHTG
jgi:hypothetical protein